MKFYKMIQDNEVIGAINSDNFVAYQPVTQCFLRSDEKYGEFVNYNGSLYRDTWMKPIVLQTRYTQVQILEIDEATYNIFISAIENNEEIINEKPEEEIIEEPEPINPNTAASIAFIRESKINQMNYACRMAIENGFDLIIHDETQHFSLTTQDQLNLMSLSVLAQTQSLIPYHADGEQCVFYTAEEINEIVAKANELKIYHTTYYNALKNYINSLETIEEIAAIEYGIPIPDEYKSDVLKILEV